MSAFFRISPEIVYPGPQVPSHCALTSPSHEYNADPKPHLHSSHQKMHLEPILNQETPRLPTTVLAERVRAIKPARHGTTGAHPQTIAANGRLTEFTRTTAHQEPRQPVCSTISRIWAHLRFLFTTLEVAIGNMSAVFASRKTVAKRSKRRANIWCFHWCVCGETTAADTSSPCSSALK